MATGDIRIVNHGGHTDTPTWTWQTEANTTVLKAGEPCKFKSAGSPYVIPLATADLTIGTDTQMVGITATLSDQTTAVDGTVDVYMPLPGMVWGCAATTAANFDTQSEIDALVGDRITITLAASTYTMNEDAGDGANNAFYIVGGDPRTKEVWFTIRADATQLSGESV